MGLSGGVETKQKRYTTHVSLASHRKPCGGREPKLSQ